MFLSGLNLTLKMKEILKSSIIGVSSIFNRQTKFKKVNRLFLVESKRILFFR